MRILISGAGIAGPTLAYWLLRHGFQPTIVERASSLRKGGYVIDFWGLGYDVAEKMNLLDQLRSRGVQADELRFVGREGRRVGGFSTDIFQSNLGDRFISILRSDLAALIYETVASEIDTVFGETITSISEDSAGVDVTFSNGSNGRFDLVIGADGLHSPVRRLVFGLDTSFEKNLGYMAAAFSTTGYEPRDEGVYVCYSSPGKQIARYALSKNRTVFFLIFAADESGPSAAYDDKEHCVRKLEMVFGNEGWESERMLRAMRSCDDLYLDRVSQIRMPSWSEGRVALVGDAAFCPSLLAGQGAALAMAGSYTLAGELKESNGDYKTAFKRYEEKLRPFIAEKQKGAENFASWFAPKTTVGIFVRNQITKLFSIPVFAHRFVGASIADRLSLRDY